MFAVLEETRKKPRELIPSLTVCSFGTVLDDAGERMGGRVIESVVKRPGFVGPETIEARDL